MEPTAFLYALPSDVNDFVGLVGYVDAATNGLFIPLTLVAILIIMFIAMKAYGNAAAFLASSFITAVLALLLSAMGLVTAGILLICILVLGIALLNSFTGSASPS